jgi:DNA-binding GntR family transcriptional regulator
MKNTPTLPTSGNTILSALRAAITTGTLAPGAVLRQADLALEFGVSRIPVRDALQVLQAEGLVRIEPNRGAFVCTYSSAELTEIYDLRVMLETSALHHAIPAHTERSLRRLAAIQRELDDEDLPAEWLRLDRAFHEELYGPCARPRTLELIAGLRGAVERFSLAHLGPDTRRPEWNDEHQQLMAAVRAHDSDLAATILTAHLRETQRTALAALDNFSTLT